MLMRLVRAPKAAAELLVKLRRQEGGRDAASHFRKIGLRHEPAIHATRLLKQSLAPIKAAKRSMVGDYAGTVRIPADKGFLKVPDAYLDGTQAVVSHCAGVFDRKKEKLIAEFKPPYAQAINFAPTPAGIAMEDPEEIRPILQFFAQPKLFDMMADYIGELPAMSNVALVYTQPTDGKIGPQQFHRDRNAWKQLHLVMPIWRVSQENGPFTLLPADRSADVTRAINNDESRIPDEIMFKHCSKDELIPLEGEPGTVYLCNPGQCIHFGARATTKPRLLLIVNISSPFEGAEGEACVYRSTNRHLLDDGSRNVRALLNV